MALVVIYDACVLYPAPLRDLLIRLASSGLVRARWTEEILEESFHSLRVQRPDLSPERLARTRTQMIKAVPDCIVTGYENLIEGLSLPDPNDRHVLAAAIQAGAQVIVTFNLRDFPRKALDPYGMVTKVPDEFVLEVLETAPEAVSAVVREQCADLKNPPRTLGELLDTLRGQGLDRSVHRLQELFGLDARA